MCKLAIKLLVLFGAALTLTSEARAQLDSSCTPTPDQVQGDTNPVETCSFDANRTNVTWLVQQSPVPPNSQVVGLSSPFSSAIGVLQVPINVCWVPAATSPSDTTTGGMLPPNAFADQYSATCAPLVVNGQVTAQDTNAGFNGPFNGCTDTFQQAAVGANCDTVPTKNISVSLTNGNPKSMVFTIALSTKPGATTTCMHTGATNGWHQVCLNGQQPPPPFTGAVTYKWTFGLPPWSDPKVQKEFSDLAKSLAVISLAGVTLAIFKVPVASNAVVSAALAWGTVAATSASETDPPDLNYQTVVTPTPPSIDLSGFPPAAAALMQLVEQQIGLFNGIATTDNRATGANIAGDAGSQQLQTSALPGFEQQGASVAAQLPAALAAWGQELLGEGVDPRTITLSDVQAAQQSIATNGLPNALTSQLTALGADANTITAIQEVLIATDPVRATSVAQNLFNYGPLAPPVLSAAQNQPLLAAVLPVSRAIATGKPATAFATIINTGSATATGCGIAPDTPAAVSFSYQTTDPATNTLTGTLNTPVDIAAGASQSYVISVTPTLSGGGFPPLFVNFDFFCGNANVAPVTPGLNTLLLSSPPGQPADIVALAASGDPGIVDIPGATGTGAFAVATVNVGSGNSITVNAIPSNASLPISINICQTNPQTGQCLATPASSVTAQINAGDTPTFGFFVTGSGTVPFDPTNNRVIAEFFDSTNTIRGATSVAVRTQ